MSQPPRPGGLPPQTALMTQRATFRSAYAVLPHGTMRDIVTSRFPGWDRAKGWVLARPLSGFAETFSWILLEIEPDGGSDAPEPDGQAEGAMFIAGGEARIVIDGTPHDLAEGDFAFLPPGRDWTLRNTGKSPALIHWIRKRYEPAPGLPPPEPFVTRAGDAERVAMPDTEGRWSTARFMDPEDLRHDMHVNIVSFEPGASIPFEETHVMEHGLFMLEGKAVYKLNDDWVEVEAGDFLWLRAFCPQACYAAGPGPFRYLLYKDVNRLPRLDLA